MAPGYEDNSPGGALASEYFLDQTITQGRYLRRMPANPFNNSTTLVMIANGASFPTEATGDYGWVYQPATQTVRLDWPGADDGGVPYFEY